MAQVIKKVAEDITQPVTTYIRNRNNPDSKIAYRPINPSSKVLLKNRPKCLLSCDTEAYFQGGHCRQVLCAAATKPHGYCAPVGERMVISHTDPAVRISSRSWG